MTARAFATVVMVGLAALGCGGSSAKMLTAADVDSIPPGTRTGSSLSGEYVVTSISLDDCECRSGTCAMFHAVPGSMIAVLEQDGTLQITGMSATDTGGVNADNTFSCGGTSAAGSGTDVELATGTFDVSGGMPTGMHFQLEDTVMTSLYGTNYDCDLLGHAVATYEGPTPLY